MNADANEPKRVPPAEPEQHDETVERTAPKTHRDGSPSVDASTLGSGDRDKLLSVVRDKAKAVTGRISKGEEEAEKLGWELIQSMLLVRETFEKDGIFDDASFQKYADQNSGRVRGKLKNPAQRLAKLCMPKKTKRQLLSKYGYVLGGLEIRGVRSNNVMAEFEKSEPIKEGGRKYAGMERFVRVYKQEVQAERANEGSKDPFEGWSKERLARNVEWFIRALDKHNLLSRKIRRPEDILNPNAT